MKTQTVASEVHSQEVQDKLEDLIIHARKEQERVRDPRFQALLETTAEVLNGLKKAFFDYSEGTETAWKR